MSGKPPLIMWADCEMTGLDPIADELIEVAVIATDAELQPLDEGVDVIITPGAGALAGMGEFVRAMHTASGLLDELAGGVSIARAQDDVLAYVQHHAPTPHRIPLGGNSIATDRAFLARQMPAVNDHLSYRSIDVSSIKELAKRWYPVAYQHAPAKHGGHRALADIIESIRELDYYRRALMPGGSGPDADACVAFAEQSVERFASLLGNR